MANCRRSGLRRVLIGVESGSQEMMDRIKKDIKVEQVLRSAPRRSGATASRGSSRSSSASPASPTPASAPRSTSPSACARCRPSSRRRSSTSSPTPARRSPTTPCATATSPRRPRRMVALRLHRLRRSLGEPREAPPRRALQVLPAPRLEPRQARTRPARALARWRLKRTNMPCRWRSWSAIGYGRRRRCREIIWRRRSQSNRDAHRVARATPWGVSGEGSQFPFPRRIGPDLADFVLRSSRSFAVASTGNVSAGFPRGVATVAGGCIAFSTGFATRCPAAAPAPESSAGPAAAPRDRRTGPF